MAGTNQFLAFATGTGANVLTPANYAAAATLVAQGFQSGVAPSQQVNTPLRQATFVAAAVAQLIADANINANDDGDLATFKTNLSQVIALPRGAMFAYPSSTPPAGCLSLNGAAISRTAYAFLYSLFGTTFGAGDGSTTFNLPDLRNKTFVGSGSLYTLGSTGGSKDAIVVSHNHSADTTISDPGHSHAQRAGQGAGGGVSPTWSISGGGSSIMTGNYDVGTRTTGVTASTNINAAGVSGTDANMMPYLATNIVIKY